MQAPLIFREQEGCYFPAHLMQSFQPACGHICYMGHLICFVQQPLLTHSKTGKILNPMKFKQEKKSVFNNCQTKILKSILKMTAFAISVLSGVSQSVLCVQNMIQMPCLSTQSLVLQSFHSSSVQETLLQLSNLEIGFQENKAQLIEPLLLMFGSPVPSKSHVQMQNQYGKDSP